MSPGGSRRIQEAFERLQAAAPVRPDFTRLKDALLHEVLDRHHVFTAQAAPGPELSWLRVIVLPVPVAPDSPAQEILPPAWHPGLCSPGREAALILLRSPEELIVAAGADHAEQLQACLQSSYPGIVFQPWTPDPLEAGEIGLITGVPGVRPEMPLLPLNRLLDSRFPPPWALWLRLRHLDPGPLLDHLKAQTEIARPYAKTTLTQSQQVSATQSDTRQQELEDPEARIYLEELGKMEKRLRHGLNSGNWLWYGVVWAPCREACDRLGVTLAGLARGPLAKGQPMRYTRLSLQESRLLPGRDVALELGKGPEPAFETAGFAASDELAPLLLLPTREGPGYATTPLVRFGSSRSMPAPGSDPGLDVGEVIEAGQPTGVRWRLPLRLVTHHLFITGMSGGGKTNTCFHLLHQLQAYGIPFWIIEPVKREYRDLLARPEIGRHLKIYTLGDESLSPLRLNPFQPPEGTPLASWLGGLKTLISGSFALYGAMPHLLESALYRVYQQRGWDTERDVGKKDPAKPYPTLSELHEVLAEIVREARYGQELTADFQAALTTRIHSLTVGSKGAMLNTRVSLDLHSLLQGPVLFEVNGLTNDDEAALVMGLLLMNLAAVRRSQPAAAALRHATLIEEAHRLLPEVGGVSENKEIAQPRAQAVRYFVNMLAELRAAGEAFIVVDQSPARIVGDTLKNTGTKVVHRLSDREDYQRVGDAMVLNSAQKETLARLPIGQAVVYGADSDKAFLVRLPCRRDFQEVMGDDAVRDHMEPEKQQRTLLERAQRIRESGYGEEEAAEPRPLEGIELLRCVYSGQPPPRDSRRFRFYVADRAAFLGLDDEAMLTLQAQLDRAVDPVSPEPQARAAWSQFHVQWTDILVRQRRRMTRCTDCPVHVCLGAETDSFAAALGLWKILEASLDGPAETRSRAFLDAICRMAAGLVPVDMPDLAQDLTGCLGVRVLAELNRAEPWKYFKDMFAGG
ncbi:MAG: ATP-binding protein [Candidatus Zixiibacteriota bacterium]|nr:MAG: ATP-binding protein [candidate division Zixibacteria bacterium]